MVTSSRRPSLFAISGHKMTDKNAAFHIRLKKMKKVTNNKTVSVFFATKKTSHDVTAFAAVDDADDLLGRRR